MKKLITLFVAFICLLAFSGCIQDGNTVDIDFPFEVKDIENIEMYHHTDSTQSEKKVIESKEDIKELYEKLESITCQIKESGETTPPNITSFRFNLSDGTNYELVYIGYGVKRGRLKSSTGKFDFFTSADIGWNWRWLNEDLEAVTVDESELPK